MRKITIILFLLVTTITSSQEFYQIEGTERILSSKDSIQPFLNRKKNSYNKTSVEKYGYIATNISYDLGKSIKRNDSTITFVELNLDLQKVDYKREEIFELENRTLPEIDVITLNGNKINNKSIEGKVTFINLWFVNCAPCLKEIPQLNNLKKGFEESVNFIAITFDPKEKVIKFLERKPYDFEIVFDKKELLQQGFKVSSYPKILIADKSGKIRLISNGIKEDNADSNNLKHSIEELEVELKKWIGQ
jgi:thiol-disulfide isomerase/thioredoxin